MDKRLTYEVDANGCFNCTSHAVHKSGYPTIKVNNKKTYAHRYVYMTDVGEIPDELVVRHKCDNRRCINPKHLELGTVADNNKDARERGRNAVGEKNGNSILNTYIVTEIRSSDLTDSELAKKYNTTTTAIVCARTGKTWKHVDIKPVKRGVAKGERASSASLTECQVKEIKDLLQSGVRVKEIAHRYGINSSSVTKIKKGYSWKHVL